MRFIVLATLLVTASSSGLKSVIPQGSECSIERSAGCYGTQRWRIGVLTMGTTKVANSVRFTSFTNELYTSKHGYTYLVERCAANTDIRHLWNDNDHYPMVWSKSLLILKHLPHYDYLLMMDGDALFINHSYSIESFIEDNWVTGASVLAQSDCYDSTPGAFGCWNSKGLNTGILLVKNTPDAVRFLKDWAVAPTDSRCNDILNQHPREQICAERLLKDYKQEVVVLDTPLWRGLDGSWIIHAYQSRKPTWFVQYAANTFNYILRRDNPDLYAAMRAFKEDERELPWAHHPSRDWR